MRQTLFGAIFFAALFGIMAFNIYIIPIIACSIFGVIACWMMGTIIDDTYYNYKHRQLK